MTSYDWALIIYVALFGTWTFLMLVTPEIAFRIEQKIAPKSSERIKEMWGDRQRTRLRLVGLAPLAFVIHGVVLLLQR